MRRRPKQSPAVSLPRYIPGAIVPDALYTLGEASARLEWGEEEIRAARRRGLKIHRSGKRNYVLGSDLLQFITGGRP